MNIVTKNGIIVIPPDENKFLKNWKDQEIELKKVDFWTIFHRILQFSSDQSRTDQKA